MIKIIALFALIGFSLQVIVPAARSSLQAVILPQIPDTDAYPVTLDNGGMDNFGITAFGAKRIMPLDFIAAISPDITYQVTFGYQCGSLGATLHIATLGKFTARMNNGPVMSGDDPNQKFTFPISNLFCQGNIFKVTVTSFHGFYPSLIFAIVYDNENELCKHNCLSIFTNKISWDPIKCECACGETPSDCYSVYGPQVWAKYPVCACKCKNILSCAEGRYFDTNKCACKCSPVSCQQGFQDPYSCKCVSFNNCLNPVDCVGLRDYSWAACKCLCREQQVCIPPMMPDSNCGCY